MSTVRIQVRRGLSSEWTAANPVLAAGEMGVETNTNKFKFGNGSSTWTALSYAAADTAAIGEISQDAIDQALSMGAGLTKTYNDGSNTITITVDTNVISTKAFATSEASAAREAAISAAEGYTDAAVNGVNSSLSGYLETGDRGIANGVASLDGNVKVPEAQLKLTGLTTHISTEGDLTAQNVVINGSLIVSGTTTTIDTQNVAFEDALLSIGKDNTTNILDLGFVANHNTGVANHTGLVRDASADKWKLFKGVTDTPTTVVNFAQGSLDTLALGRLEATSSATINNAEFTGTLDVPVSSIISASIANGAVTTDKIESQGVTEEKLAANAVVTQKIANSSVTEQKLATNSVTNDKVADSSISTDKIATGSVTDVKLAVDSVTSEKIQDNAVVNGKIADGAITETKIANNAVTESKIAAQSITNAKIVDGAEIAQSKIAGLGDALDAKAPLSGPTFAGLVVLPESTTIGNVDSTEITYLNGVTSSIQTQFGSAATALSNHASDTTDVHGIADTALLATKSYADTAEADAITAAGLAADTKVANAVAALTKSSVGLANVDNTSDASKPVSTAQASAIATAKSEAIADATAQVNAVIAAAPAALNTLDELAAALGDDANFATTVTTSLASKAPIASPTFTGTVTVAAAGVAFTDGTQTKEGVPSRTVIGTAIAGAYNLSTGGLALRDQLIPVSGAHTITVPTNATTAYPIGTSISFYQSAGADAVFAEASGVTILRTPGLKLRALYSSATITKVATDTWLLAGDLKA
jgi:hypothetical protein